MRISTKVSAALVAILSVAAASAEAQVNSASINATAIVLAPLNVVGATVLDFGQILPGVAKAVAVADATAGTAQAGRFDVAGATGANINLTFSLPVNLVDPISGGTLPIGTWTGYHNDANSATAGGASFTPSAAASATAMSGTGTKFVFVGATVSPATSQAAGTYTGSVQMTVDYF